MRKAIEVRVRALCILALVGLLLPLLSPWTANWNETVHWIQDLAVHWQLVYFPFFVATTLVWAWASRALLVLMLLPLAVLPLLTGGAPVEPKAGTSAKPLCIATANVHLDSTDPRPLLAWLESEDVDVAVLHEVSPAFAEALKQSSVFPYQAAFARNDPFGVAVVSKRPFDQEGVENMQKAPLLTVSMNYGGSLVRIAGLHPMPPLSPEFVRERDAAIQRLIAAGEASGRPTVIAGDFNATRWSSAFSVPRERGWSSAAPLNATWPSVLPSWLGIGIDHILVDSRWSIGPSRLGPSMGSDHRPLVSSLRLKT